MKAVLGTVAKIMFYLFCAAVVFWTASLTLAMVRKVLPGDELTPWFALALFDGGALCWLMTFIFHAKGLAQRAIALLLLVFDLAGVVLMSMGELLMSGQTLTTIPENMGLYVVYGLGASTAINLIAAYAFHVSDPATSQIIELQSEQDKIEQEAMDQARGRLREKSILLGARLADRLEEQAMYNLRLTDGTTPIVDGQIRDARPAGQPAPSVKPTKGKAQRIIDVLTGRQPAETIPAQPTALDPSPDQLARLIEMIDQVRATEQPPTPPNGNGTVVHEAETTTTGFLSTPQDGAK